MPRYHFVVCEADHKRDDLDGVQSHPLLFGSCISTFLFSLKLVGRWRTRSVRCDQWQSKSAVARCRCKPLAGRNAGRLGYHSTSAASCRYLQCGCTQQTVALFLVWRKSVRHFQIIFSSLSGNKFIVIRIIFSFIGPDAFARGLVRFRRNPVPDLA